MMLYIALTEFFEEGLNIGRKKMNVFLPFRLWTKNKNGTLLSTLLP